MSSELWTAIIGGLSSLAGAVLGVIGSAKVITYRVTQLEEQFRKQCDNCAVMDGRVDRLESRADVIEERIRTASHRIDNLEKKEGIKS